MTQVSMKMPQPCALLLVLFVIVLFIGAFQSVVITDPNETIKKPEACDEDTTVKLPCEFTNTTDGSLPPITQWRILNTNEVVGSINSSRILNPGVNYMDRIKLFSATNTFDSSIVLTDRAGFIPDPSRVFTCEVDIASDTDSPMEKNLIVEIEVKFKDFNNYSSKVGELALADNCMASELKDYGHFAVTGAVLSTDVPIVGAVISLTMVVFNTVLVCIVMLIAFAGLKYKLEGRAIAILVLCVVSLIVDVVVVVVSAIYISKKSACSEELWILGIILASVAVVPAVAAGMIIVCIGQGSEPSFPTVSYSAPDPGRKDTSSAKMSPQEEQAAEIKPFV